MQQQSVKMHLATSSAHLRGQAFLPARPLSSGAGRCQTTSRPPHHNTSRVVLVRAEEAEEDFESRLAALKRAKGETPYGEGKKRPESSSSPPRAGKSMGSKKTYDYSSETLHFESGPHGGDVAVNLALGATLIWLPLSVAAVGRAIFVKYKFTDRRISVISSAPWKNEQLDAAYQEVKEVVTIGRGIGLWGDMVVTLRDGSKIEMRALPEYLELKAYILKRRDELTGGSNGAMESSDAGKGFAA